MCYKPYSFYMNLTGELNESYSENHHICIIYDFECVTIICVIPVGMQYFFLGLPSWLGVAGSGVCTWPLLLL